MNTYLVYCMQYIPYTPGLYTGITFNWYIKACKRNDDLRSLHVLGKTKKEVKRWPTCDI